MPIYRANGNRYNIPDDKIQDFERRYPESKVEMYDGEGKKYAIPLSKRNKFQQRYEKWSYVTEETKKESPDPSGSNQNPPNIIVSEDELENSMADYEESLGHGKYGARNTPLFQKVRQAVTSAEQIADGIINKNWISQSPSSSARDSEIGEVSVGRRGSTSTRTPVSDAYKSQFDKPLEDRFADARTRLEKDVVFQFENMLNKIEEDINENSEWRNEAEQIENEGDIFKNYKGYKNITEDTIEDLEREGYVPKEMGELSQKRSVQNLTRKYISEARDVIEMYKRKDGNGLANFADAFARSFDSGILTLGATDAIDMGRVLAIANKIGDNGEGFEKLTKEEQQLMAAFSLLDQIQGSLQLDTWQNIGQGTMQSLPFLAQFALTGGVGAAASAATKAAAKTAVKKIIGRSASKAVSRIAANAGKNAAGRVAVKAASKLGNAAIDGLVGGAVMALTSGAAHTAEDVMSRMVGDHDIRLGSINDPSGELKTIYTHHGVEDRESLGLAFLKGFAANLIENGTEYMGNYMGLNLGKLLSHYKGGRQLLTKPLIGKSTRFARQVGKLTGFNGFIPEVAEEELGMLLNAATVGDVEWEDIKDPEQQFQTVMAVGIMSLGFQVANSIGVGLTYNQYRKAKKRYESKDLGEGLSVDDIIHGLDNVPLDRRADYVMATVNTHDLGKEDAKDLQDFVMARTGYEFILGKIESDAEEAGDKAAEAEMRLINKEMGGKVTVTLLDGREAILTVGNVSLEPNAAGEYTSTTQSGSLIAVPVGIGNTPIMVSPKDIRSVSIMSTEDAVGQARAMAEDITKTNMASQIENEADEVESDEQSRTPSSTMSGGEIGELSPRDEGVEKQPLYRKSELEIGDVVTFNDYSDPENPGVERTLKIIGIDDSGVYVEDVVDGVPLPLSIKPEQITNVKGKEKNQTADKESGQQTTLQTEAADTSEYTRFVEDGTVEDSTVLRIANKIANGEQLTGEEEAMRQEVSQRVEDKIREIQQNVEGKEETDRWAKYRKSNGEVDEKKMPLREQFEYGEEIAGVKAMIEVAKAGTKKTQSEIARLEKEIEREISPVKRVNKEKQLKSLNERLGTYQQYLEDNNSDLQSLKATPVNIVDRIAALGDIKSLRDYILRLVATGNIKFKWGDTDSSKGLASHLGINDSPGERRKRISLLSNSGYTPEQLAHNIWEQQDVQNSDLPFKGYETDEILDEILDVMSSIYSPSQALELAEQIANEDLRKQEMASQDYESHELEQSSIEQIELEPLPDDLAPRNDIAFRRNELGEIQFGQTQINERESNSNKENSLSSQEEKQIDSQDEILQSIPQRERGTEAQKDRRMEEAERAIRRSQGSGTNETQFGGSQSALSRQEIEARAAEEYAKENGLWIPMDKVFDLGTPGPSGNENDTYISNDGYVYKVNNLMNSKGILPLFDRIKLHNQIFPSSRYEFVGFTGFDGRSIYPIFRQAYVHESTNATPEEIEEYMNTLGFSKINEHKYTNGDITISDLRPRNVLKDTDGDLYVVDAEFQQEGRSDKETADKTNPRQPDDTDSTGSPLSENESSGISSSPTNSETPVSDIKDNPNASTGQEKTRLSTQKTPQERRREIREYIGREAGKLNIPVRVVEDVSQISPSEKNYTKKLKSLGWYDKDTGEIVIVAPNHGSIRNAQRTLLHEAVAHYGLPAMLGRENFDKLCDQVWDSMTDRERATFAAYLDDKSYDSLTKEEKEQYTANDFSGKRAAADEYLAHFAEEGITTPSLWSKIKRFIKEAFRKIGIDLSLTDSDIAYMLWKSKNRITDKDSMTDIIRKSAADTRIKENIGNTRFRINTPVEQRGDLVAIHNISEDKLKEAIGLGGFPMPSIAITKPEVGHSTFGDISLVFGKETINPTDRRNKVYGEDAWTPTFPTVGYKLNEDKTSDIYRRANKAGNLPLFNPVGFHSDNYKSYINGIGSDSLVNHFKDSYGAKQLYLAETGNAVEKFEMHEVEKYSEERIGFLEKVLKEIGIERLKKESYAELENEIKQILGKYYNVDFDKLKPSIARIRIDNAIKQAVDYAENGNSKTESDVEATKKKIDDRIDQKKFEEWLRNLFNGVVEKKGIRNETDLFTPIGNRRKWESLYDEITLDNVVKAMKKQSAKGGQGLFGGSIFGAAQSEFKNIDEIREAARERIRELSNEEIEGRRNEITDRLSQIDIPMRDKGIGGSFDMIENITDSVRHSHTAKGIYNYLHDIYPGMTMDIANEIADIVKDIQQMSARYFEAKPYRAVGFDEIKFAVVPDNTDVSLLNQLQSMKIPVETYEKGNNEQRKQVLNESSDKYDTRFRTIVVNPRYGSKIETVRTNHTSVYKAVDKYLRENFDEKDYTTHTAKTGSRYLELNIGGDTLKVRFANHTPRMEASDNMDTIGNGKEITFFPGGDMEVEIDISLSGDRSKEIIDLIKGMKEYSSSEVKKEVSRLIDGAKTDPFPDVASPQLIEELSRYIGTEMAGTLDTQIAEYYKYHVNENVYKQESKSRDSKLKQNKYVLEQYKTIFRDFVQESPKLIKAVGGGYWYNGATGSIRIVPPFPIDYGMLSNKLMSSHFIPLSGINKKEGKRQIVQEYVDEWSRRLTDSGIFLSEEYVSEGAKITEAQQEIDNIREQYNFWVKAKLNTGTSADIRYRTAEGMEEVNQRFNEELAELTEENAQSKILYLGRPNEILSSVGIPDKELKLYGNKLIAKAKKHGFDVNEVKDLPQFMDTPIMVFSGSQPNSFAILTEMPLNGKNVLVSIGVGKGVDVDFNIVTSVYGKKDDSIIRWINSGNLLYVDREKALNYLRIPAPIAGAQDNSELLSATNIVENFENPKLAGENSDGTMNTRFRREAPDVSSYIKISMDGNGIVDLSQLPPEQSQRIRKSAPAAYGAKISGDIASFPDYQEAENCLTYIFNNNDIIVDDIRNSIDNGTLPQDIAMIFDAALRRGMARRVWIDRYQPLEALQNLISSTLGKEISEKENAWEYTGFMDSRIKAEADEYNADYYLPLLELYEKIIHGKNGIDEDTLVDYMLIKHGIERNQVMRREALEEWEESHKGVEDYDKKRTGYIKELSTRDYSGYFDRFKQEYAQNYDTAEDFISEVESLLGENTVISLWDKIKKATNKTLDISVQSGLVSKEDADTYKKRFQFYVPLRGFSEETMDQMYDSNIRINPGSTVNKQAKGRTSRADNPLVSIMAMANTEIARANKNKMKQRLLTLLAGKDVRNKFGYSYEVEYKDGKKKILKYKPKPSDKIKKITTISNIYQLIPKYEIIALDTNGNPILDEHGNKTWVETDEVPSAEQLESGMARFSKAYPSNRGTVHKTPSQMDESTVDVFVAGKKVSILFTNPLVSNSINGRLNLDKNAPRKIETPDQWYNVPGWLTYGARHLNRLGARTTRALSQFYTTYSPAFFLFSNFARDFSGAFAYNSAEKSFSEAWQIAALAPDSFAAMRRYIWGESKNKRYTMEEIDSFLDRMGRKGKISKPDYDIAAYLFVSRGGETGYISANTVEDYRKSIDNAVKYGTVDMNKQAKAIKKGYMAGVKAIQDTARLMESVTRLNQFVAALREGKTIDAAITDAKNVSTNFNRRGSHEGVQWLFDNYAFLNASLQGTDRLYRGIKKYKKGFAKIIGTIISIGFLDSLLCAIFSGDDDRWGDSYHALPETKRYNNLVIPVGEGKFIFIPLAQSLRGFHAWGAMLADLMTGYHKRHPLVSDPITPLDFLAVIGQNIVPITYGSWTNAAPTWAQPIAHIAFNENFMGRPLYKETPWNENLPEFRKAYGSTPKGLVKWSEFVNEMTGGNYAEKGWLEQIPVLEKLNNPAVLQQLYLGYVPGLFRVLGQAYNAVDALVTKTKGRPTDFALSDVPIIGAAVGEANDRIPKSELRSKWYEFANKARDSKRADSELLKELFIDEFIENTRDSDKVLSKSVYDGLNVHIRNLMKLEGMAETWEDDLVSGDLPADEAIRTSAEIASLRNTIDNTLYDIINELKIAQ
ncbi:LPD38 domain-containing protein [Barnesiella intestinihominis]|uniref:putative polyvalent protein kinase domain-containing protein n=1 Tax=Barnesiella intestinihominis TaxID=487174 RepID=UPI0039704631